MKVAVLAWEIEPCAGLDEWLAHADRVTRQAEGCDLAVMPELVGLELLGPRPGLTGEGLCDHLAQHFEAWVGWCSDAARRHGFRLVGGSHVAATPQGYVNRAVVAEPDGTVWFQDKLVLTRWEADEWGLVPGQGQTVRDGLGVAVCYDSEFGRVFEGLSDQGADVVAVPSFTETEHGRHRVESCCRAHATAFQCVVVVAPLLGSLGREPVPSTAGAPGVFAPSVPPFSADGVLGGAAAEFSLEALSACRNEGDVRNLEDQRRLRGS